MKQKLLTMLVLLMTAVSGAWAGDATTVFELNGSAASVGTLTLGASSVEASTVNIHTNTDEINVIKISSSYNFADGKYFSIAPASGSFKKGDKVSIAVCFSNSDDTKEAKAVIYAADGSTKLYTTATGVNGRTSAADPTVEEYVLTQDADKLYIGRQGNTNTYVTTLKVVRTAAPASDTYSVKLADGTEDADKWTAKVGTGDAQALPVEGLAGGEAITLTYTGSKKVLGVKAEKKAKGLSISLNNPAVGQLIGNDGKNYDATAPLPDGVTAVAMICHLDGDHGVALALEDYGFNTWNAVKEALENYEPKFTNATWDMPTEDEWGQMNQTAGGYGALRDSFANVGGTNMQKSAYWSSTSVDANNAKSISFFNGSWSNYGKDNDRYTRLRLAW